MGGHRGKARPGTEGESSMQRKRNEGIRVRHSRECAIEREAKGARLEGREPREARCSCEPSFEAWVFDKRATVAPA